MTNLNDLAKHLYQISKDHGFDHSNIPASCANLHGEVSELWEAYRKNKLNDKCDKPVDLSCAAEELADIVIQALEISVALGVDIEDAVEKKSAYNETRSYLHGNKKA